VLIMKIIKNSMSISTVLIHDGTHEISFALVRTNMNIPVGNASEPTIMTGKRASRTSSLLFAFKRRR
jgi:hypothetical protein